MAKIHTPKAKAAFAPLTAQAASFTGYEVEWASYYGIVAQLTVAGQVALAGTFKLQYSLDGNTWADVPALTNSAVTTIAIAADGIYTLWYPLMFPAYMFRVAVVRTAGAADFSGMYMATKVA